MHTRARSSDGRSVATKHRPDPLALDEDALRAILEQAPDGLIAADERGRILFASKTAAERLSGTPIDIVGRKVHEFVSRAEASAFKKAFHFVLNGGRTTFTLHPRSTAKRPLAAVELQGTPAVIGDSRVWLAGVREAQSFLTSEQMVRQERLHAMGVMASGIVHDFRNTLTPILGFCQLLQDQPALRIDDRKLLQALQQIRTGAEDATHMVDRLSEFYRPRSLDEEFAPINPNDLVRQVVELTASRWKVHGGESSGSVQVDLDLTSVPAVSGRQEELRQSLVNLLFNALDALGENGTITLRTYEDAGDVLFQVSDTGKGMSPETLERCLEPYYTTKGEHGTGLGLASVYGTIERHGGSLHLESEEGKGTTATIRLPVAGNSAAAPRVEASTHLLRILVVDDEPSVRTLMDEFLRVQGHVVETASNGVAAKECLRHHSYDLVITDLIMPEMSGIELAKVVKRMAPDTAVILITGHKDMIPNLGAQFGRLFAAVLTKPLVLDEVLGSLSKISRDQSAA